MDLSEDLTDTAWRGSIYKLVWMDLIIFLLIYYSLNLMYRFILDDAGKVVFENVVLYCYDFSSLIPLSFVLGFYVSVVMTRWWNQYTAIPFPDPLAVFVSATIHGQDERGRVMRRTVMRYVCLCVTMTFTMISPRVKKRFPTLDHLVEAGLLHGSEKEIMDDLNAKFPRYSKHWLPIVWASSIITRARKEGRIRDDFAVKTLIDELNKFRGKCGLLLSYDNISVPLVYTQVVTLAVYSYFGTSVMGHQHVLNNKYKLDFYFPIFTTLQFFFYVGWLKVAESLINPFGDDDDDFEVNWMVDRNLQVSYLIVDEMHHDHPELVRDQYWDEVFPQELPYTVAAAQAESMRNTHPLPSTANIAVKQDDQELITPSSLKIDGFQSFMQDNMQSGPIMFSAKQQSFKNRKNSKNSLMGQSVPDNMPRVSSVTSVLKRLFSKEDSKADTKGDPDTHEMNNLVSSSGVKYGGSSKRITNEVIEEVDEQNTITSQRSAKESRPSVMGVFGPPPPSMPITVPHSASYIHQPSSPILYVPYPPLSRSTPSNDRSPNHIGDSSVDQHVLIFDGNLKSKTESDEDEGTKNTRNVYDPFPMMSRSVPGPEDTIGDGNDTIDHDNDRLSIGSATDDEDDEFENLKKQREEERLSRLKLNLARSMSIKADDMETEVLLRRRSSTASTPQSPFPPAT